MIRSPHQGALEHIHEDRTSLLLAKHVDGAAGTLPGYRSERQQSVSNLCRLLVPDLEPRGRCQTPSARHGSCFHESDE